MRLDAPFPPRADDDFVDYQTLNRREKVQALLIEDDAADAAVISRLAARSKQLDFDMTVCLSGDQAQRLTAARAFDVIYVDYWLGLNTSIGFIADFTRRSPSPCVLLTGLDEPDIRRIAFRAGVRAFLSKEEISTQAIEAVTLAVLGDRWRG